jgi:hypothetical protein
MTLSFPAASPSRRDSASIAESARRCMPKAERLRLSSSGMKERQEAIELVVKKGW